MKKIAKIEEQKKIRFGKPFNIVSLAFLVAAIVFACNFFMVHPAEAIDKSLNTSQSFQNELALIYENTIEEGVCRSEGSIVSGKHRKTVTTDTVIKKMGSGNDATYVEYECDRGTYNCRLNCEKSVQPKQFDKLDYDKIER